MKPLPAPNEKLYPNSAHSTVIRAIMAKLCIMVASTFFLRTSPP